MKLNVLLYADAPSNPRNLPADWPAEVREVADNAPAPTAPWIEMTVAAYLAYRAAREASVPAKTAAELADEAAEQAERELLAQIATVADDMIAGTGTSTERQRRVELWLGRLAKRLLKTGVIP